MAANMDGVGELGIAEKLSEFGMITCLTKQHDIKKIKQFKKIKSIHPNIALSIGIKKEDFQNLDKVLKEYSFIKFICIDVANGYSEHFSKFVKSVRDKYPTKTIIAGNVVTADMTQELILSGADIVKVGIGPGSVCTTRIQTGVGYPQLSAVIECADAAHGLGAHIIADGGCTCPGDVAKGFGAGADFVMLGGMFAGHDEGKGKKFRGHGKDERGDRDHQRDGTPFKGIDLTDDQLANLAELRESFKDISKANRETLRSFKEAQRDLIRSSSFSQDSWNALVAQYKDDLVSAGVEKAKQRQAMFAVLTPEQQAELKAQREEGRKLRDLLRS